MAISAFYTLGHYVVGAAAPGWERGPAVVSKTADGSSAAVRFGSDKQGQQLLGTIMAQLA